MNVVDPNIWRSIFSPMSVGTRAPGLYKASGIREFLRIVNEIRCRKTWFEHVSQWDPWFRGQQKANWPLKPKLYRHRKYKEIKAIEAEDEIREEFIKRAPIFCENLPSSSPRRAEWEWYFMMQHFGVATRLLDWSEGALIALYFAARNNFGEDDAAVWMLDPYQLNRRVIGREWIIPPSATGVRNDKWAKRVEKWLPIRFSRMRGLPLEPVAIEPTHVARRISSQHSCFTIHGTDELALEKLHNRQNSCLVKIVIPGSKINDIKKDLRICGINEATIFPDLDGLGRSINARWELAG